MANTVNHSFTNNNGSVKLGTLNNAYVVLYEPMYGEPYTETFSDLRAAQIAYSYAQHYYTQ